MKLQVFKEWNKIIEIVFDRIVVCSDRWPRQNKTKTLTNLESLRPLTNDERGGCRAFSDMKKMLKLFS